MAKRISHVKSMPKPHLPNLASIMQLNPHPHMLIELEVILFEVAEGDQRNNIVCI